MIRGTEVHVTIELWVCMSTVRQHRNARHLLLFAVLCSLVRFIFSRATLSLSLFFVLLVTLKDPEIQSVIWGRTTLVIVPVMC